MTDENNKISAICVLLQFIVPYLSALVIAVKIKTDFGEILKQGRQAGPNAASPPVRRVSREFLRCSCLFPRLTGQLTLLARSPHQGLDPKYLCDLPRYGRDLVMCKFLAS